VLSTALEGIMHIHPAAMGLHATSSYGLANERAANAQRAADVRKKLLKAGQAGDLEVNADPDAALMMGQWLDSRHSQVLSGDEYRAAAEGRDPELG
jgi:hypothetical protein